MSVWLQMARTSETFFRASCQVPGFSSLAVWAPSFTDACCDCCVGHLCLHQQPLDHPSSCWYDVAHFGLAHQFHPCTLPPQLHPWRLHLCAGFGCESWLVSWPQCCSRWQRPHHPYHPSSDTLSSLAASSLLACSAGACLCFAERWLASDSHHLSLLHRPDLPLHHPQQPTFSCTAWRAFPSAWCHHL